MGTNYYHRCERDNPLSEVEHIGKASGRCQFLFHTGPGLPRSWAEWRERLAEGEILDGEASVPLREFELLVEAKRGGRSQVEEIGRGAFRSEDGYDFLTGEFS